MFFILIYLCCTACLWHYAISFSLVGLFWLFLCGFLPGWGLQSWLGGLRSSAPAVCWSLLFDWRSWLGERFEVVGERSVPTGLFLGNHRWVGGLLRPPTYLVHRTVSDTTTFNLLRVCKQRLTTPRFAPHFYVLSFLPALLWGLFVYVYV